MYTVTHPVLLTVQLSNGAVDTVQFKKRKQTKRMYRTSHSPKKEEKKKIKIVNIFTWLKMYLELKLAAHFSFCLGVLTQSVSASLENVPGRVRVVQTDSCV